MGDSSPSIKTYPVTSGVVTQSHASVAYLSQPNVTKITALADIRLYKLTITRNKRGTQHCPAQPHDPTCRHLAAGRALANRKSALITPEKNDGRCAICACSVRTFSRMEL
jgi:hypothetical protein